MTASPDFLAQLARITAERDLEQLEDQLLSVFRELIGGARVFWLRIDSASDRFTLCQPHAACHPTCCRSNCAPPLRQGGVLSGAPPQGFAAAEWQALLDAMPTDHPLCVVAEQGSTTLYPLRGPDNALGYLVARDRSDAPPVDADALNHVLAIFRNYYALLEENQKDKLTGLLNRKTFDERIGKLLQLVAESNRLHPSDERRRQAPQGQERFWLAVVDIDHFKRVNDTFGHLYGDEVLLLMAQIMKRTFRHNDLLFRFGGEEFVIVIGAPDIGAARIAFEKLRRVVAGHPFPQIGKITISLGATEMEQRLIPSALVGRADEALYRAKRDGRDRLYFYEKLVASGALAAAAQQGSVELF